MRSSMFGGSATIAWAALSATALFAGCGTTEERHLPQRSFVGQVTEVDRDYVCVGAHEASGECFAQNDVTRGLRVGDCVQVSYETDVGEVPYKVLDLETADAESHWTDCPG